MLLIPNLTVCDYSSLDGKHVVMYVFITVNNVGMSYEVMDKFANVSAEVSVAMVIVMHASF